MINEQPSVKEELVPIFDKYGTTQPPDISRVQPIKNTTQSAVAGEEGSIRQTKVGHIAYSSYFNCLVYVIKKDKRNIIRKVKGRGFAISKSIIDELKEKDVKYVFGGIRQKNNLLIFPLDKFSNEFHIDGWDKQLYARVENDVLYEIPNGLSKVLSDNPSISDNAITMSEAMKKIQNNE